MKKLFVVFSIAAAMAVPATAALSQQMEAPATKEGHGMTSGSPQGSGMMCPMMGMMGEMPGGTGGDPKMMGRMMEMRGEMMMKMGEVMMKYGKETQKEQAK